MTGSCKQVANPFQRLCEDKAVKLGIRTARLPIGTYLAEMPTRKVLTVNQVRDVQSYLPSASFPGQRTDWSQVVEILLQYVNLQDWSQAFHAVMPKRKYDAIGKRGLQRRERAASSRASNQASEAGEEREDDDSQYSENEQDLREATEATDV